MSTARFDFRAPLWRTLRRWAIVVGVLLVVCLVVFYLTWSVFFEYVPPGSHLVITKKNGADLPPGQRLAQPGQRGILEEVKGEGWQFVLPIEYTAQVEKNTEIPPGKVGIVTARGGRQKAPGATLARADGTDSLAGEQGIRREVLPPGNYRINAHGYEVEIVPATEIQPGYVGVLQRMLVTEDEAANKDLPPDQPRKLEQSGVLPTVLQPGFYYVNTKQFKVHPMEVGIFQTAFHYDPPPKPSTAITFVSKGGFEISLDCTIEWEVLPEDMPKLVAEYGDVKRVQATVIEVQAKSIGRDKGSDYGADDFLEGSKREKFQQDFSEELKQVCKEKNVQVHSAFIRNIIIPDNFLSQKRRDQLAKEEEKTNKAKEATAATLAEVAKERQKIQQRVAEVESETKKLTGSIDQQVENTGKTAQEEIGLMKSDYINRIADLEAQRTKLLGEAKAQVTKLKDTATSSLYQMQMEVFQNDANAFLRYTLAKELNPELRLRLFQSGPGTFWTNMDGGKNMNLMFSPAPAKGKAEAPPKPPEKDKVAGPNKEE